MKMLVSIETSLKKRKCFSFANLHLYAITPACVLFPQFERASFSYSLKIPSFHDLAFPHRELSIQFNAYFLAERQAGVLRDALHDVWTLFT